MIWCWYRAQAGRTSQSLSLLISNERLMTPRAHRALDRKYKTTQFDSYGARYFLAAAML